MKLIIWTLDLSSKLYINFCILETTFLLYVVFKKNNFVIHPLFISISQCCKIKLPEFCQRLKFVWLFQLWSLIIYLKCFTKKIKVDYFKYFKFQIHFLITLAANYTRIKISKELTEYRDAVEMEELELHSTDKKTPPFRDGIDI